MNKPPRIAKFLLELFLPFRDGEYLIGDYEYVYNEMAEREGKLKAKLWYWRHVLRTVPEYLINSISWGAIMFSNYLKTAFRNFSKRKVQTAINLFGLSIGIAAVIFILLWVNDELSYDRFHDNADRIYRISLRHDTKGEIIHQTQTAAALAETIMDICPEVEMATRVRGFSRGTTVTIDDRKFNETKHGMADEYFFSVFSFKLLKGNSETALLEPRTAVLSETAAHKYFGNQDPIGKTFTMYDDDFIVTGVYMDMLSNSHFHFDILLSVATIPKSPKGQEWWWNNYKTYVVLQKGADTKLLEEKLNVIIKDYIYAKEDYEKFTEKGHHTTMPLQKLTDIHLYSNLIWEFEVNGNGLYVQFLSFIALFILIIAIVNYVNLSTANSATRAREIGIRKSVGSTRSSLIRQFLTESVLTSFLSFVFSICLVFLLMPLFRDVVGKPWLAFDFITNPQMIFYITGLAFLVGLVAGIYPSLVLSSFEPISAIRSRYSGGKQKSALRNTLVVFQFAMSIILLIGALVVSEQMKYIQKKNLGFNKEQVLVVSTFGELGEKINVFKEQLRQNPAVKKVSVSTSVPGASFNNLGSGTEGNGGQPTNIFGVDDEFPDVYKIEMAKGRFFSRDIASDSQAVVISETLAKERGVKEPGETRMFISINGWTPFNIIGIMKDFHYESFHEKIKPLELVLIPGAPKWRESYVSIRLNSDDMVSSVEAVKDAWQKILPNIPFEYTFMDDIYNNLYKNEERTSKVFTVFTLLGLLVACLGLIGLTSFVTQMRTKEIGIRKVMGSRVSALVARLSAEFTKWVLVANLIAWPAAYFVMNSWLEDFAYRIEIEWWMFAIAGLIAVVISLITVSTQSIKAANTNPVEALKYE